MTLSVVSEMNYSRKRCVGDTPMVVVVSAVCMWYTATATVSIESDSISHASNAFPEAPAEERIRFLPNGTTEIVVGAVVDACSTRRAWVENECSGVKRETCHMISESVLYVSMYWCSNVFCFVRST